MPAKKNIDLLLVESDKEQGLGFADLLDRLESAGSLPFSLSLTVATNVQQAGLLLRNQQWVLTNGMLKIRDSNPEINPCGVSVVMMTLRTKKPVLIYSDLPATTQIMVPSRTWSHERGLEVFTIAQRTSSSEERAQTWLMALTGLVYTATALEMGISTVDNNSIFGGCPGERVCVNERVLEPFFTGGPTDLLGNPVLIRMADTGWPRRLPPRV